MKNENDHPKGISRRAFLKDTGLVIGGAALSSLALSSACSKTETSETATASTMTSASPTSGLSGATQATGTISEVPYLSNTDTPGVSSLIASDRLYSIEHIWVKDLGNNTVYIGMTDKLQMLFGYMESCRFTTPGKILTAGDSFGFVMAGKINAELTSPVSGEVLETNQSLVSIPQLVSTHPYEEWILKIRLSQPAELNDLISPMYYAYLQSKDWIGSAPAMH